MHAASRILLLLGAPVFVVLRPTVASDHSAVRKCTAPVSATPQYFVDGRTSDLAAVKTIPETDIIDVTVLCVSPVDYTVIKPGTKAPGLPAIAIWTAHGPSVQLQPLLKKINDAQQAHFAATGNYATTIGALSLGPVSNDVRVTLNATATQWRADAEVNRPTSPRCTVFDGALDVPILGPKGVVRCSGPA